MQAPDPLFQHRPLVFHDVFHVFLVRHELQGVARGAERSLSNALQF